MIIKSLPFYFAVKRGIDMKKIIGYALVLTVITFFLAGVITLFAYFGLNEYMQGVVSAVIGYMAIKMTDEYFKDKEYDQ